MDILHKIPLSIRRGQIGEFMFSRALSGGSGGGSEIEFTIISGVSALTVYRKEDFTQFKILITNIVSSYPMSLKGSNDKSNYTSLKTWSAVTSTYEDILSYVGNYTYFTFQNTANVSATVSAKAKTV